MYFHIKRRNITQCKKQYLTDIFKRFYVSHGKLGTQTVYVIVFFLIYAIVVVVISFLNNLWPGTVITVQVRLALGRNFSLLQHALYNERVFIKNVSKEPTGHMFYISHHSTFN